MRIEMACPDVPLFVLQETLQQMADALGLHLHWDGEQFSLWREPADLSPQSSGRWRETWEGRA